MPLEGRALLALWNDRSPDRHDYDVWHTREHVPQRLTVPGISRAVRYSDGDGPLPAYFTLYTLDNLQVFSDPDYIHLMKNPTPWSQSMRPDFARFFRVPCALERSVGGGIGGWCVAALVTRIPLESDLEALIHELADFAPVSAVHYGATEKEAASVPFAISQDETPMPAGVLIVEGYEGQAMAQGVREILVRFGESVPTTDTSFYTLAFALHERGVQSIRPYPQPA